MNNLPEIRDIYIPDGVSVFPLAYGWWFILGFIILGFIALKVVLWIFKTSRKIYSLKTLKKIEPENSIDAAIQISELMRRICAIRFKEASTLYGTEWIDFLEKQTAHRLSPTAAELLISAPFMKKTDTSYSPEIIEELKNFCKTFIGASL